MDRSSKYKSRNEDKLFGKAIRLADAVDARKKRRDDRLDQMRNIDHEDVSIVHNDAGAVGAKEATSNAGLSRMEKLKLWREEKSATERERAKQAAKPVFKVNHILVDPARAAVEPPRTHPALTQPAVPASRLEQARLTRSMAKVAERKPPPAQSTVLRVVTKKVDIVTNTTAKSGLATKPTHSDGSKLKAAAVAKSGVTSPVTKVTYGTVPKGADAGVAKGKAALTKVPTKPAADKAVSAAGKRSRAGIAATAPPAAAAPGSQGPSAKSFAPAAFVFKAPSGLPSYSHGIPRLVPSDVSKIPKPTVAAQLLGEGILSSNKENEHLATDVLVEKSRVEASETVPGSAQKAAMVATPAREWRGRGALVRLAKAATPADKMAILSRSPLVEMVRRTPKVGSSDSIFDLNFDDVLMTQAGHLSPVAKPSDSPMVLEAAPLCCMSEIDKMASPVNALPSRVSPGNQSQIDSSKEPADGELGVQYFKVLLETETLGLNALADRWTSVLHSPGDIHIDDDTLGLIRTTVGQAQLLVTERFDQFANLVAACEFGVGEKPTMTSDLRGFWDMVDLQIQDVRIKFENLDRLEKCGYVMELPAESNTTSNGLARAKGKKRVPAVSKAPVASATNAEKAKAPSQSKFALFKAQMRQQQQHSVKDTVADPANDALQLRPDNDAMTDSANFAPLHGDAVVHEGTACQVVQAATQASLPVSSPPSLLAATHKSLLAAPSPSARSFATTLSASRKSMSSVFSPSVYSLAATLSASQAGSRRSLSLASSPRPSGFAATAARAATMAIAAEQWASPDLPPALTATIRAGDTPSQRCQNASTRKRARFDGCVVTPVDSSMHAQRTPHSRQRRSLLTDPSSSTAVSHPDTFKGLVLSGVFSPLTTDMSEESGVPAMSCNGNSVKRCGRRQTAALMGSTSLRRRSSRLHAIGTGSLVPATTPCRGGADSPCRIADEAPPPSVLSDNDDDFTARFLVPSSAARLRASTIYNPGELTSLGTPILMLQRMKIDRTNSEAQLPSQSLGLADTALQSPLTTAIGSECDLMVFSPEEAPVPSKTTSAHHQRRSSRRQTRSRLADA